MTEGSVYRKKHY